MRRVIWPILFVFPTVILVCIVLYHITQPPEPELTPEQIKARQLAKAAELLEQWADLSASEKQNAVPQVAIALESPFQETAWEATQALGELGKPAVPELVQTLQDPTLSDLRRGNAAWALGLVGPDARETLPVLRQSLKDPSEYVRANAVFALSQVGSGPAEVMPDLIQILDDNSPDVWQALTDAVLRYREAAVPSLRKAMLDPNPVIRKQAVAAIGLLGEQGESAIPDLFAVLRDPDNDLGPEAAEALGLIGPPALKVLAKSLQDPSAVIRLQAVDALGKIGKPAVPTLIQALKDENTNIRLQTIYGLQPFADDAVEPLIAATRDQAAPVRELALEALATVKKEDNRRRILPAAAAAFADPKEGVRKKAATALYWMKTDAKLVLKALEPILKHEDPDIRLHVYGFLAVYPADYPVVPYLARGFLDESEKVQRLAVATLLKRPVDPVWIYHSLLPYLESSAVSARTNALRVIWRSGPPALPFLYQGLADQNAGVRAAAVTGLCFGPYDLKAVFAKLLPLLKDNDTEVRARAMAGLSPHGLAAIPYLAVGMKDPEPEVRLHAVESLARVFAKKEHVLPLLKQALQDDSEQVRYAAVKGMRQFGMDAVPTLIQAFADPSKKVWKRSLESMLSLKAQEKDLLPILIEATQDEDPAVRAGAAYAMERFNADGVPPLVALLRKEKDPAVLWAAVDTIDTIGMPARAAMADLEQPALNHPDDKVRYGALVAMVKIHGLGKYRRRLTLEAYQKNIGVVVPHLIESLASPNAEKRWQACVILGAIGEKSKAAIPALKRVASDQDLKVREAALATLRRLENGE